MAIEHANSFVNNFFEDEEFTRTVIENGFSHKDERDTYSENEIMVMVANEMGFNFDLDEYQEACKEYMESLGGWESAKKVFSVIKVATDIAKNNNNDDDK